LDNLRKIKIGIENRDSDHFIQIGHCELRIGHFGFNKKWLGSGSIVESR